ncbi:MAG TPA: hypothetical protein VE569_08450, partial [Acidimicrobiia bacterium]|nr:hypothetical protein [Acidimicrobiia bacterium]
FLDDPMNEYVHLARNWVRQVILPRMRELNPRVDEAMARTARSLSADADYLESAVGEAPGEGLAVGVVATLPRALADRIMRRWLETNQVLVSADLLDRVWSVARGRSGAEDLEGGRRVVRDGAMLRVR